MQTHIHRYYYALNFIDPTTFIDALISMYRLICPIIVAIPLAELNVCGGGGGCPPTHPNPFSLLTLDRKPYIMASSSRRWSSRPQIKGYQDALYAKKNKQLYHERCIEGTIVFIVSNMITVF
jgi:hypothetical protein